MKIVEKPTGQPVEKLPSVYQDSLDVQSSLRPDPEVQDKTTRRQFTADYKLKILSEIDASKAEGEIGAILRREGLYHSNIKTWRQQREKGELIPKKRGRKPLEINPLSRQNAQLEKENKRLKERLARAETIIEFQKKIAEILGKSTGLNS